MKVLHVLASNKYSGAENVVCQIIDMFKQEIDMAYCSPEGDIRKKLEDNNIKYLSINKLNLKELKKIVAQYNPDVIHAHDLKAICYVSMLSKQYKKIGHIHVNDKEKMSKLSLKSVILRLVGKKFNHLFWVSNSCFEEYKFKKNLQDKSSVLYNIINEENLITLKNKDTNDYDYDIVYLGRLTYQKNPLRLISIAKQLKEKNNGFKMAIIGSGDMENELKKSIIEENLQNNVFYLGYMSNAYKLLSQAKVMIMTSRYEGTPMVALEALSLGVPIISTKTDGMVDLIKNGDNGFIYTTDDEACNYIYQVLNNPSLQQVMKNNCTTFSSRYNNIDDYKQKLLKKYKG